MHAVSARWLRCARRRALDERGLTVWAVCRHVLAERDVPAITREALAMRTLERDVPADVASAFGVGRFHPTTGRPRHPSTSAPGTARTAPGLDTRNGALMPDQKLPMPGQGDPRFSAGLVVDVAHVIEDHGYDSLNGGQVVELQQHLFHLLHGSADDACIGGVA
jgi:hypothetical protein